MKRKMRLEFKQKNTEDLPKEIAQIITYKNFCCKVNAYSWYSSEKCRTYLKVPRDMTCRLPTITLWKSSSHNDGVRDYDNPF